MTCKLWSISDTCKLIELYRESPVLWDARCPDYKNRYKKADALVELAEALTTTPEAIDKKIKNLNSQYARERRLHEKLSKSGAGKEFNSKWFGFNLMEFLRDKNQPRKTVTSGIEIEESDCDNVEDDVTSVIPDEYDDDIEDVSMKTTETPSNLESIKFKNDTTSIINKPAIPCTTKAYTHEQRSAKVFNILQTMHENKKSRLEKQDREKRHLDEFDSFGDMLGKQLRTLKTHHAQSTVQYLINNIMYEAKMGKYDHPPNYIPPTSTEKPYLHHPSNETYENIIPDMSYNKPGPQEHITSFNITQENKNLSPTHSYSFCDL